jgi:hypothetical protein
MCNGPIIDSTTVCILRAAPSISVRRFEISAIPGQRGGPATPQTLWHAIRKSQRTFHPIFQNFRTSLPRIHPLHHPASPAACIHTVQYYGSGKSAMSVWSHTTRVLSKDPGRNQARRNRCQRGVLLEHFLIPLRSGGGECITSMPLMRYCTKYGTVKGPLSDVNLGRRGT